MEAILHAAVPITFVTLLVIERAFPAREQPVVRFWLVRGVAFFALTAAITSIPPALFAKLLAPYAPIHLDTLPVPIAGVLAFLLADLVHYGVHRLEHTWSWLWRWTHQLHHAAERIDVAGAAIFHPFELLVFAVLGTIVSVSLGLAPEAAALAGTLSAFAGMFQHLNVRTPQWLGYLIQRPEAHSIHHARGVHAYNYGNVTWWDLAFGTFRNPVRFTGPAGFWDGASRKLVPMLVGRDVTAPTTR